jgi:hypothetical protein
MTKSSGTVVVVALHGGRTLEDCLASLESQGPPCVVVLAADTEGAGSLRRRFPCARFVDSEGLSVPHQRSRGVDAADGEWVALLEDSSIPQPRWWDAVSEAFGSPAVVAVGGPTTLGAGLSARQAALACCEYGRFHPTAIRDLASGGERSGSGAFDVARLPGNNIAYRLQALRSVCGEGEPLIETQANARLLAEGGRLQMHPDMAVEYRAGDDRGTHLAERFQHGRLYGGMRARGASMVARAARLATAILLPFVLSGRSLKAMRAAIPPAARAGIAARICCMETAWGLGEAVGYLAGPGRALEAWR